MWGSRKQRNPKGQRAKLEGPRGMGLLGGRDVSLHTKLHV